MEHKYDFFTILLFAVALAMAIALSLAITGCGRLVVEGSVLRPEEATATVLAQPTPAPSRELGWLAYVQEHDIWVRHLPDGEPLRLTVDGKNTEPRWSPSGAWLAFRKGQDQVWVMKADGSDARVLFDGAKVYQFAWSPAADRLAFTSLDTLYVAEVNSYGVQTVFFTIPPVEGDGARRIGNLLWSPSGGQIAFEYRLDREDGTSVYRGVWQVEVLIAAWEFYPRQGNLAAFTPDGQYLVIWKEISSSSGGSSTFVALPLPSDQGPLPMVSTMLAYPDYLALDPAHPGRLVFVEGGGQDALRDKTLMLGQVGAKEPTRLSPDGLAVASPAWSPDGTRLAFSAMPATEGGAALQGDQAAKALMQRRIYLIQDVARPKAELLTDDALYRDEWPRWSSDGSALLFVHMDDQNAVSLWMVEANGGAPYKVTGVLTRAPDWYGQYGHTDWSALFDWWQGPDRTSHDHEAAAKALVDFFAVLSKGDYETAASLFGGDTQSLVDNNPDLDPGDHAALWEAGCRINGLQCLAVRSVAFFEVQPDDVYVFTVEFNNPDGSLFSQPACCGEEGQNAPPVTRFTYRVQRSASDKYRLLDLPVYSP